jgi:hypothetical protein
MGGGRPAAQVGAGLWRAAPGSGRVAAGNGLRDGGRVIIRPDGYLGHIGDVDTPARPCFALLAGGG